MFQRTLRQTTWQIGRDSSAILMAAPLKYLLITLKVVDWKKSLLVIHKFLRLFVDTLIVDDKYYLLNRDSLTQPIQMHLYQKQKKISEFFSCISKIIIKF